MRGFWFSAGLLIAIDLAVPAAAVPITPSSTIDHHRNPVAVMTGDVGAAVHHLADTSPYAGTMLLALAGCAALACANGGRRRHRSTAQAV